MPSSPAAPANQSASAASVALSVEERLAQALAELSAARDQARDAQAQAQEAQTRALEAHARAQEARAQLARSERLLDRLARPAALAAKDSADETPLTRAVCDSDAELVRFLAPKTDPFLLSGHRDAHTALARAIQKGHRECAAAILDACDDPKAVCAFSGVDGQPASFAAVAFPQSLDLVLPHMDFSQRVPAVRDGESFTLLMVAAREGSADALQKLLPHCDPNATSFPDPLSPLGRTALAIAAARGHVDCVRLLLAAPGLSFDRGLGGLGAPLTPLAVAIAEDKADCALELAAFCPEGANPLPAAALGVSPQCFEAFLSARPEWASRPSPGLPHGWSTALDCLLGGGAGQGAVHWGCVDSLCSVLIARGEFSASCEAQLLEGLQRRGRSLEIIPRAKSALEARDLLAAIDRDAAAGDSAGAGRDGAPRAARSTPRL